jgi:hypothetical protein
LAYDLALQEGPGDFNLFFVEAAKQKGAWERGYGNCLRDDLRARLIEAWTHEEDNRIGLQAPGSE